MNVWGNDRFVFKINQAGVAEAFLDTGSGTDILKTGSHAAVCRVVCNGAEINPLGVQCCADSLEFFFADGLVVKLECVRQKDYMVMRVLSVTHERFDSLILLDLPLEAGAEACDSFCACALALNLKTRVDELPGPQWRLLARCYPRFGVVGAAVAIVGCPFGAMRSIIKKVVEAAPELPRSRLGGPWALDAPENKTSYLFGVAGEDTADEWIKLCRDFGVDQLHFCGTKAFRFGDYAPHPDVFPHGLIGVRRVVERLHAAGLKAGLHTMSFSIHQASGYVTPIPDKRLAKERSYTLAGTLSDTDQMISLREDCSDLPLEIGYFIRRSMTLLVDDELIEYTQINNSPPFGVGGCRRGAWGTRAVPHARGAPAHHLRGCWGLFAPDGESSLFGEIAGNIANVVNECGFDMVYLDGLDGIHILGGEEARWHYGSRFAFEVFNRLRRPVIMEMAAFLHHLWFIRSRVGAWDNATRGFASFLDHHVRSNTQCARIFLPAHLGWWVLRTAASRNMKFIADTDADMVDTQACKTETTFGEDAENLCVKALGADVGFALQGLSPQIAREIPHLARLGPIFQRYFRARRTVIPDAIRAELRAPGTAHMMVEDESERIVFKPYRRLSHKISGYDDGSAAWGAANPYGEQAVKVRIETLWSAAPYDDSRGVVLMECKETGEFQSGAPVRRILNSGKTYSYPGATPGTRAWLEPIHDCSPANGARTARFRADCLQMGCLPASSPSDRFSLLDHGERIYEACPASWVWLAKRFPDGLDLRNNPVCGCWVHGDGSAAVLNIQMVGSARRQAAEDYYVPLNFKGWRYLELIEPESERFEEYAWPYGRCIYDIYRSKIDPAEVAGINLWLNNIPLGGVTCLISELRALPPVKTVLRRVMLDVGGRTVELPFELSAGDYVEIGTNGVAALFDAYGRALGQAPLTDGPLRLASGINRIGFRAEPVAGSSRAKVTLFCADECHS